MIITKQQIKQLSEMFPDQFFFLLVKERDSNTCDIAAACKTDEDVRELRRLVDRVQTVTPAEICESERN